MKLHLCPEMQNNYEYEVMVFYKNQSKKES